MLLFVLVWANCSPAPLSVPSATPSPCSNGRPPAEIAYAGNLPFEIRSPEIECVLNAVSNGPGHDRVYRLKDGRQLHVYEYAGQLPQKPTGAQIRESGESNVAGRCWVWSVLDHPRPLIVMSVQVPAAYIELGVPLGDQEKDLDLLRDLASKAQVP